MKNAFVLVNFNTYYPVTNIFLSDKIVIVADEIKKKYPNYEYLAGIVINEFVAGSNGKYITELEEAFDYKYAVIPADIDYKVHKKTILTIIMVKKDIMYEVLPVKSCLPNRIVCVRLYIHKKNKPLIFIGIYAVQTQVFGKHAAKSYIMDRYAQKEEFFSDTIKVLDFFKNEPCMIMGDAQEASDGPHLEILKLKYGFYEKTPGFPTAINSEFSENAIDHAMLNEQDEYRLVATGIDTGLIGTVGDHAMLTASIE
jgi:hypothetical protein